MRDDEYHEDEDDYERWYVNNSEYHYNPDYYEDPDDYREADYYDEPECTGSERCADPRSNSEGASPGTFELSDDDCVDRVAAYEALITATSSARNIADGREILQQGKEAGLGAGEMKHLVVLLSDALGLAQSVLNAVEREVQSTIRGLGYVGSPDAASSAYFKILDQYCPTEDDLPGNVWCADDLNTFDDSRNHYELIPGKKLVADLRRVFNGHAVVKTDRDVKEIVNRVADRYRFDGFFKDAAKGLPMANGFASYNEETATVRLNRHQRRNKARFRLDINFSQDAQAPVFRAGLRRLLPDDKKRRALQEVMGCVLFQIVPRHDAVRRMAILTGRAGSGKSTFIETLKLLLPAHLVGSVPPASWRNERSRARLDNLWLNYCTELAGNKLLADDQVKQIIACETVTGRHLYGQEHEIQPIAFHVVATNTLPQITDTSGAFDRRLLVLQFDQPLSQSEMDNSFLDRIREEREGIIAWAAEGAERLMARGAFDLPPGHAEGILGMKHGGDVVALFAHTQLEGAPGNRLASSELQAALVGYAITEGYDRAAVVGSGVMRRLAGIIDAAYGAKRSASNNAPFYTGVALRGANAPPHPEDALAGL